MGAVDVLVLGPFASCHRPILGPCARVPSLSRDSLP